METEEYEEKIKQATTFNTIDYSGFWEGYRRGLRRFYYGEKFGTDKEHDLWMESANEKSDKQRRDRGLGYWAGFAGKNPETIYKVRSK